MKVVLLAAVVDPCLLTQTSGIELIDLQEVVSDVLLYRYRQ